MVFFSALFCHFCSEDADIFPALVVIQIGFQNVKNNSDKPPARLTFWSGGDESPRALGTSIH